MDPFLILVFLIAVALAFDFLNGMHDAANSIATIVATRVLPPNFAPKASRRSSGRWMATPGTNTGW